MAPRSRARSVVMPEEIVTPVFQFGTSRFLQAHADLFIHEASEAGSPSGPVTVVAISGSAAGRARLQALASDEGYPVVIRGLEAGRRVEREIRVKSIRRALDAELTGHGWSPFSPNRPISWSRTRLRRASPFHPISSSISRAVHRFLRRGIPLKLLVLLAARFAASARPVVMLPTELVPRNGDTPEGGGGQSGPAQRRSGRPSLVPRRGLRLRQLAGRPDRSSAIAAGRRRRRAVRIVGNRSSDAG